MNSQPHEQQQDDNNNNNNNRSSTELAPPQPFGGSSEFIMPPPKRKRTMEPDSNATEDATDAERKESVPVTDGKAKGPAKGPVKGPAKGPQLGGTLAALKSVTSSNAESSRNKKNGHNDDFSDANSQKKNPTTAIDLKTLEEDTWQAPKDQDGSGYTKLNEKFAGRY
jgi:hypothetical protein